MCENGEPENKLSLAPQGFRSITAAAVDLPPEDVVWLVQHLAQRHFDMQTRGIEPAAFRYRDAGFTHEPRLHMIPQ